MAASKRCFCLAALTFIFPFLAAAQQKAPAAPVAQPQSAPDSLQSSSDHPGTYTYQVNARMVVLDVVVTDSRGHIVDNLAAKDFQVYQDKALQTIHSFDVHRTLAQSAVIPIHSTAELDKLEPDAPVSILVLDELNTKFVDEAFTRYSLKKYLDAQSETLEQPTMLVAVNFEHFMVLRDYTTSKSEILAALDHHLAENPWKADTNAFQTDQFNGSFASLLRVAQATAGHPGHKNLIWVGTGFPSIDPTALMSSVAEALKAAIETCTNMLRDSRITLFTIDPAGLAVSAPTQDDFGFDNQDPFGGQFDFNTMAIATGGKAFFGRNDVDKLIGTSIDAGANFYTLAYVPSDNDDATAFHHIRVVMNDPSLTASTREGYYAHAPPIPPAANEAGKSSDRLIFDLATASNSMLVYDAVPFTIARDPVHPDSFDMQVKPSDIPWDDTDPQTLTADIAWVVETFDKKGKMLNHQAKMVEAQSKAQSAGSPPPIRGLTLHVDIPTAPPVARVRFIIRMNRTGKIGAQNIFLVDPATLSDPTSGQAPQHKKY